MKRFKDYFSISRAMIGVTIILFASASCVAQVAPCQAKANYEAAEKAAEIAQESLDNEALPKPSLSFHKEKNKLELGHINTIDRHLRELQDLEESAYMWRSQSSTLTLQARIERERLMEEKVQEAITDLESIKRPASTLKAIRAYIAQLRAWLNSRKKRDEADQALASAQKTYNEAIIAKDEILGNARATFDKEQAHVQRVRARLEGRAADDAYRREVTELLTRTRGTYERLLGRLSELDCFADARNFMDDLKTRMKKIDANMEIVRNTAPGSSSDSSPSSSSTPSSPRCSWTGQWDIGYKDPETKSKDVILTLAQSGNSASGAYPLWYGGKISKAQVSDDGMSLTGGWSNNYKGGDGGDFTISMSADCKSWSGRWSSTRLGGSGTWSGTKIGK